MAHIVLHSLKHPDRESEDHTDICAMLLGYKKIIRSGRKNVVESRGFLSSTVRTTTTTYGYLNDAQFGTAYHEIKKIWSEYHSYSKSSLRCINQMSKMLKRYIKDSIELKKQIEYIAKKGKYIKPDDAMRIAYFCGSEFADIVASHISTAKSSLTNLQNDYKKHSDNEHKFMKHAIAMLDKAESVKVEFGTKCSAMNANLGVVNSYMPTLARIKFMLFKHKSNLSTPDVSNNASMPRNNAVKKVRNHYDNLKVTQTAPLEVITAAYEALSKQYHPDYNKSEDAERIFKIINSAYEVLSDNSKRREHDMWIETQEQEQRARFVECEVIHPSKFGKRSANSPRKYIGIIKDKMPKKIMLFLAVIAVTIIVVLIGNTSIFKKKEEAPAPPPYSVPNTAQPYIPPQRYTPVQDNQNSVAAGRPVKIPKIQADHTGYVKGSPKRFRNGYASVTVDNTGNDSAVLVKLFNIDFNSTACYFTILAKDRFTITKLNRGNYDVKYTFYKKGFSRSEPFYLKEIHNDDGVQYSNMTMTLYKVIDGNMRTTEISEDEFVKGD